MKLLLTLLLLVAHAFGAGNAPAVPECFKVHSLIRMDEEHYWANWTNACPYTIDSVYVMVSFRSQSGGALGDGVWGLHFVTPGTHQVTRFTSPLSVPDYHSVHVAKITTDPAEALHTDPVPQPLPLIVRAKGPEVKPLPGIQPARSEVLTAGEHLRRGRDLLNKSNYHEAIIELSEAIRKGSDSASTYNARGFAYYMVHDYRQANADLNEAIRLNPHYVNAFQNRSHARRAVGDIKGSAADAKQVRALTARPHSKSLAGTLPNPK